MSIFNTDPISRVPFDAKTMASWEQYGGLGRINGWWEYLNPDIDFSSISKQTLDEIIDNVLVYIYYYAKLGINQTQLNKFQIGISTLLFGVTSKNFRDKGAEDVMDYVIKEFEKRGFEVIHNPNDARIIIGWYKAIY